MNREEILKKAQPKANKMDEMQLQIISDGSRYARAMGMIVCVLLMVVKLISNQPWADVYAVLSIMNGTVCLYRWKKLKQKSDLAMGLLWLATTVILLVVYIVVLVKRELI